MLAQCWGPVFGLPIRVTQLDPSPQKAPLALSFCRLLSPLGGGEWASTLVQGLSPCFGRAVGGKPTSSPGTQQDKRSGIWWASGKGSVLWGRWGEWLLERDSALTAGDMWALGAAADMDITLGGPEAPLSGLDSALKISTWSLAGLCSWHLDAHVCLFLHRRHGRQECHEAE